MQAGKLAVSSKSYSTKKPRVPFFFLIWKKIRCHKCSVTHILYQSIQELPDIPQIPGVSHSHSKSDECVAVPYRSCPTEGKRWGLAHFCSRTCYVIPTKLNMQKPEMCFMLFVIPADNRYRYIFIYK